LKDNFKQLKAELAEADEKAEGGMPI